MVLFRLISHLEWSPRLVGSDSIRSNLSHFIREHTPLIAHGWSHTHTHTYTHTHTHIHTLSLSVSLTHTHTHTHSLSLSHIHTHTHTHTYTHEYEHSPCSVLKLTGPFSLGEAHSWIRTILPDIPDQPSTEDTITLCFKSTFIDTQLEAVYE